ncbi:MAG: hydantoinase/oxoprolinase family protein [Anaerolineales bacterium]
MGYSLGIDTGGTHTDLILMDRETGQVWTVKVPTTSADPLKGIMLGIDRVLAISGNEVAGLDELIYGTTLVTNMLVQREKVKTGLITTKGFRDVLEIGRAYRSSNIYDIQMDPPPPLVSRDLRLEVTERINFQGQVLEALDEENCRAVVRKLKSRGVETIAVCLLHSYINPSHEQRIKAIIAEEYPEAYVSLSYEINPVFREYERTSTTVLNAYVTPQMVEHLDDFEMQVSQRGLKSWLYTMQANGGKSSFSVARKCPVNVTNSGPVAGAIAGAYVARVTGFPNAITLDMGGTSCDVALIDGDNPKFAAESNVEGYPVQISTIDLSIVGAGGGSVAWLDSGGGLRVGPRSAGADPGPACYAQGGTEPTVTDANLITDRLNPSYFLGGEICLDREASKRAIDTFIAQPLGMTTLEAALGILQVANAKMIRAIKLVSVERGYDPHDFVLIAFGGAGPLHATQLAEELEIPVVIVPPFPGNTSALGLVMADMRYDYVATQVQNLDDVDPAHSEETLQELEAQAHNQLSQEGIPVERQSLERSFDLRYFGQSHELNIPIDGQLLAPEALHRIGRAFHAAHRRVHGHAMEGDPVEVVNYRVSAVGTSPKPDLAIQRNGNQDVIKGRRNVFFDSGHLHCPIYERHFLKPGYQIDGPAVIEQVASTTLLCPNQSARVDAHGNLIIALAEGKPRTQ